MRNKEDMEYILFTKTLSYNLSYPLFPLIHIPSTTVIDNIKSRAWILMILVPFRVKCTLSYWMKKSLDHDSCKLEIVIT